MSSAPSYYEKIKRDIEIYRRLRRELELYASGRIKRLIERYYEELRVRGGRT